MTAEIGTSKLCQNSIMKETTMIAHGVRQNVDLQPFNTFAVKSTAKYFVEVHDLHTLRELNKDPLFADMPQFVLGGGSNVLFTNDFDGLVLQMRMRGVELVDENDFSRWIKVGAGESWADLVELTLAKGWSGLENLALIPGTVGGAAVQNIGAYGIEAAERIVEVECYIPADDRICVLSAQDCDFGYRTSIFKSKMADAIVLSVTFALPKQPEYRYGYKELAAFFDGRTPESAREIADAVISIRRRKLPDPAVLASAGSFFKNPVVTRTKMIQLLQDWPQLVVYPLAGGRAKVAAAWLIDGAGLKGYRCGDAGVYDKQALVLVNHGQATGREIWDLALKIQHSVKNRYGVMLEPEPVIV